MKIIIDTYYGPLKLDSRQINVPGRPRTQPVIVIDLNHKITVEVPPSPRTPKPKQSR